MSNLQKRMMHTSCKAEMECDYQRNEFVCTRCKFLIAKESVKFMIDHNEIFIEEIATPTRADEFGTPVETVQSWRARKQAELEAEYRELCRKNKIKNPPPFPKFL